jgi:flagellar motor switch protein FliM
MTDAASHNLLDFSSPRRSPHAAARQLATWQANVCALVQDGWKGLLARPVELAPGQIDPQQHQVALGRLPEDGLGVYFSLSESLLPSMLCLPPRLVHGLLADLLDLPGDAWPAPRPLTSVEEAMLELLFQKFAEAIGEAWPDSHPLKCRYLETADKPQRTRLFATGSALLVARIKIRSRFGEEICSWLMLKEETERLLLEHFGDRLPEERTIHPGLAAMTERVPLEIVVELGRAELSMSQAAHLTVGDVLVLDQLAGRPLTAAVEGQVKWAGLPLRIGSRQAFEITQVLENGAAA